MDSDDLIRTTPQGLYCEPGGFYIDPWQPVKRAVITHAHADHARPGSEIYLTAEDGKNLLAARLGSDARIETLPFGESISQHAVRLSLHPAGHILGSAQIRIEHRGQVCVVSGDYKTEADNTCRPFELVRSHKFITESTFGLPIYRWPSRLNICGEINDWWRTNASEKRASIVFAYAMGKAQRVLAGLDPTIGPIYCHGAVEKINEAYRRSGVKLPETSYAGDASIHHDWSTALILAPPLAMGSPWLRRFGDISTAFVSGWMLIRGARRRRSVDRGFPLSDHADWTALNQTIRDTQPEKVFVTHGHVSVMVRWLRELGMDAHPLRTEFEGEQDEGDDTWREAEIERLPQT